MSETPVTGQSGQDTQTQTPGPEGAIRYGAGIMFDVRHGLMVQPKPDPWSGTTSIGRDVIVLPPAGR